MGALALAFQAMADGLRRANTYLSFPEHQQNRPIFSVRFDGIADIGVQATFDQMSARSTVFIDAFSHCRSALIEIRTGCAPRHGLMTPSSRFTMSIFRRRTNLHEKGRTSSPTRRPIAPSPKAVTARGLTGEPIKGCAHRHENSQLARTLL